MIQFLPSLSPVLQSTNKGNFHPIFDRLNETKSDVVSELRELHAPSRPHHNYSCATSNRKLSVNNRQQKYLVFGKISTFIT